MNYFAGVVSRGSLQCCVDLFEETCKPVYKLLASFCLKSVSSTTFRAEVLLILYTCCSQGQLLEETIGTGTLYGGTSP